MEETIKIYSSFIIVKNKNADVLVKLEDIHIIEKRTLKMFEYYIIVYVKTIHLEFIEKLDYIAEIAYISKKEYEELIEAVDKYKNIR
jgi:hypothetical protein